MISRHLLVVFAALGGVTASFAQQEVDKELEEASDDYMRDELGVNEITAPSIAQILKDFGNFIPVPMEIIATNPRDAVYDNRLQTSLHFGALVADGFMLTDRRAIPGRPGYRPCTDPAVARARSRRSPDKTQ